MIPIPKPDSTRSYADTDDIYTDTDSDTDTDTDTDTDADTDADADAQKDDDGDGLTNGEEAELGTDPNNKDTDNDTYWDSWEVTEGTDPLSEESRIYTGYWPYNPEKSSITGGTWSVAVGNVAPNFIAVDQHGDQVNLYDFAGQGKPIIIDLSAVWCGPCNDMSEFLSGVGSWGEGWDYFRGKLDNGDFYWVTVLFQDSSRNPTPPETLTAWDNAYPNERIPVVNDPSYSLTNAIQPAGVPSLSLIGPDMKWLVIDDTVGAANKVLSDY